MTNGSQRKKETVKDKLTHTQTHTHTYKFSKKFYYHFKSKNIKIFKFTRLKC